MTLLTTTDTVHDVIELETVSAAVSTSNEESTKLLLSENVQFDHQISEAPSEDGNSCFNNVFHAFALCLGCMFYQCDCF